MIIADTNVSDGADFSSNESGTAANRPKLTIQYLPPAGGSQPTPTPVVSDSLHVGDLDGSATRGSSHWAATVVITVHDAAHNDRAGVTVSGSWGAGASGTAACTTGTNGACSVRKGSLSSSTNSVQFSITSVTASGATYDAAANHDPDGDSDGTTIVVTR